MKSTCTHCGKPLKGRCDKKFCGIPCKNAYHAGLKRSSAPPFEAIDAILHRNYLLLAQYVPNSKDQCSLAGQKLAEEGFQSPYCTGIFENKKKQMFYLLYDIAWRYQKDNDIFVIRK